MQGDLVELVRTELLQNGTETWKQAQQRFHKESVKTHGVSLSKVREIARRFTLAWKSLSHTQRLEVCDALASGFSEEAVVATAFYAKLRKGFGAADFPLFENWLEQYVTNWANCDDVCMNLLFPCLANDAGLIPKLTAWRTSNNRWLRRASVVGLVGEAKAGLHLSSILEASDAVADDTEELVQKGAGWLLKVAYAKHPASITGFLFQRKARTSRLVLRYAAEKMSAQDRKKVLD